MFRCLPRAKLTFSGSSPARARQKPAHVVQRLRDAQAPHHHINSFMLKNKKEKHAAQTQMMDAAMLLSNKCGYNITRIRGLVHRHRENRGNCC
jgi:hypothetical protein